MNSILFLYYDDKQQVIGYSHERANGSDGTRSGKRPLPKSRSSNIGSGEAGRPASVGLSLFFKPNNLPDSKISMIYA